MVDYSTWVVSVFDAARVFGRSLVVDSEAGPLEPRAVLKDGSILGRTGQTSGEGYRRSQETYQLRRFARPPRRLRLALTPAGNPTSVFRTAYP